MDPCGTGCVIRPKKTQTRKFREEYLDLRRRKWGVTEKIAKQGTLQPNILGSYNQVDELH